jgi:hypothetical protein
VDTAPPTLNDDSWYDTADHTLGYLSLDGGNSWQRAVENGGFEGINFKIEGVRDGKQVLQMYHYTPATYTGRPSSCAARSCAASIVTNRSSVPVA